MQTDIRRILAMYRGCEVRVEQKYKGTWYGIITDIGENIGVRGMAFTQDHNIWKWVPPSRIKLILRRFEDITGKELEELCHIMGVAPHLFSQAMDDLREAFLDTEQDIMDGPLKGWTINMESFWQITYYLIGIRVDCFALIEQGLAIEKGGSNE